MFWSMPFPGGFRIGGGCLSGLFMLALSIAMVAVWLAIVIAVNIVYLTVKLIIWLVKAIREVRAEKRAAA